ncbi:MAG: DUF4360 domain-containing protein [Bacteriovoracia bacterium]
MKTNRTNWLRNVHVYLFGLITGVAALSGQSGIAAADDIYLGLPGYGGSGCPQGSASATLSPDAKTLSILFDQYVVEAGRGTGRSSARKTCNIAIPVHVPQGLSVSLIGIDYRGFNVLPRGSSAQFDVDYFFAGSVGPRDRRQFVGPVEDDYLITNNLAVGAIAWSPCGADVNLRINTGLLVRAAGTNGALASSSVDSADVQAGLIYHLQWRQCR